MATAKSEGTERRTRDARIELRTTSETRRLVERAVEAQGTSMTEFAEQALRASAQHVLADRTRFVLSEEAAAEWDALNARPARELPELRRFLERPSPFVE